MMIFGCCWKSVLLTRSTLQTYRWFAFQNLGGEPALTSPGIVRECSTARQHIGVCFHIGLIMFLPFSACNSASNVKKNTTQQHEVRQEVNQVLADVVAWSLSCAGQGIYPARGFYGEPFEANTFRSTLCNKQIAGGFKLLEKKDHLWF